MLCCRDGLTTLKQALDEYINFDKTNTIQYASDCIHENLYDMLNQETANHNLEEIVQNLKEKSRLLLSIPPQVRYVSIWRTILISYAVLL